MDIESLNLQRIWGNPNLELVQSDDPEDRRLNGLRLQNAGYSAKQVEFILDNPLKLPEGFAVTTPDPKIRGYTGGNSEPNPNAPENHPAGIVNPPAHMQERIPTQEEREKLLKEGVQVDDNLERPVVRSNASGTPETANTDVVVPGDKPAEPELNQPPVEGGNLPPPAISMDTPPVNPEPVNPEGENPHAA